MTGHSCRTKSNAERYAKRMRSKGFNASVFPKKKGYGVSVTRNK